MLARHITSPSLQTVLKWKFGKRSGSVCGGELNFASVILNADSGDRQKQRKVCGLTFHRRKKIEGKYALGGLRCFRLSGLVR